MFGDKLKKMFNINKENEIEEVDKEKKKEEIKERIGEEKTKKVVIGNDKKKIENLVFFVVLLIITILIINFIWNGNDETNKEITNDTSKKLASNGGSSSYSSLESAEINGNSDNGSVNGNIDSNMDNVENLENKLKNILSKIKGVEDVNVCLNYSESSEVVAMYNENSKSTSTEETDDTGGTRKIEETDSQKEVIYKEDDGVKTPITAKIIKPKIEGAIITAKGVENAEIKTNVIQAVEAITGLATHKIQVLVSK